MKYAFIKAHRSLFRVERMCRVLKASRSGYYKWLKTPGGIRATENAEALKAIRQAYHAHKGRYGSPRITEELKANGLPYNRKRIARLMQIHGIRAKLKRRNHQTRMSRQRAHQIKDYLRRDFTAKKPNRKWVSDITYIWTKQGWLYLCVILDLWNRKIVGWATSGRQDNTIIIEALEKAVQKEQPGPGLIFHSDHGIQYVTNELKARLGFHRMKQSMGRIGSCYDNAVVESFFHTLKTEEVKWDSYSNREVAKQKLFEYIEIYYNRKRRHSHLGNKTPLEFEQLFRRKSA